MFYLPAYGCKLLNYLLRTLQIQDKQYYSTNACISQLYNRGGKYILIIHKAGVIARLNGR
jgi:hypothetical protein